MDMIGMLECEFSLQLVNLWTKAHYNMKLDI